MGGGFVGDTEVVVGGLVDDEESGRTCKVAVEFLAFTLNTMGETLGRKRIEMRTIPRKRRAGALVFISTDGFCTRSKMELTTWREF